MSLAPPISAPDRTPRRTPRCEEPDDATSEAPCLPFPGQFATPTRSHIRRRVAKLACHSFSTILRRLVGSTETRPDDLASSACPTNTVRRKFFGDARPNLLEDHTHFDELDPLPFVDNNEETRGDRRRFDQRDNRATNRDRSIHPPCAVVERREQHSSLKWPSDGTETNPVFECYLLDVNMSGIAIHAVRSFPRGSILDIQIDTATSERVIKTAGVVVRCEPLKAGGFQVVCRLEKFLQFAAIRDVGRDLFASAIV